MKVKFKAKDPKKVAQGKKAKASGSEFELRVRKDMSEKGWVVDKFGNNVEFDSRFTDKITMKTTGHQLLQGTGKLIIAKNKWAGPNRPMMMGAGFPDFSCHKKTTAVDMDNNMLYAVIGIECKCDGWLSQLERQKCRWLLDNNVFSKILIAEKTKPKNRIVIVYHDFEEKYGKK